MSTPAFPYPGISVWQNSLGATVLRLHYTADPEKDKAWAERERAKMGNDGLFRQEYEIDGSATLGQLIFQLDKEATLEKSFPIPKDWTRIFALDPHPAVPHAMLWCAVDPWGDRWYYRELWPSKTCFHYEKDSLVGKPGPCPEDDNRYTIKEYVQVIGYLESKDNPENRDEQGNAFDEVIYKRVIDYAARAFGKGTSDDPEQPNFQQRYEAHMGGVCDCNPSCSPIYCPTFEDAKKDHEVGYEYVNAGLKPIDVMGNDGEYRKKSTIHIFQDRCPELVYQLTHVRRQQLTPDQAEKMNPTGKIVEVRNHLTDDIRYIEMSKPVYVPPARKAESSWQPQYPGIAY